MEVIELKCSFKIIYMKIKSYSWDFYRMFLSCASDCQTTFDGAKCTLFVRTNCYGRWTTPSVAIIESQSFPFAIWQLCACLFDNDMFDVVYFSIYSFKTEYGMSSWLVYWWKVFFFCCCFTFLKFWSCLALSLSLSIHYSQNVRSSVFRVSFARFFVRFWLSHSNRFAGWCYTHTKTHSHTLSWMCSLHLHLCLSFATLIYRFHQWESLYLGLLCCILVVSVSMYVRPNRMCCCCWW